MRLGGMGTKSKYPRRYPSTQATGSERHGHGTGANIGDIGARGVQSAKDLWI